MDVQTFGRKLKSVQAAQRRTIDPKMKKYWCDVEVTLRTGYGRSTCDSKLSKAISIVPSKSENWYVYN